MSGGGRSNDPLIPECANLRARVTQLGEHHIGVLAEQGWAPGRYTGRCAQLHRQSGHGDGTLQAGVIGNRSQHVHGGDLRVVEGLLRCVDGAGRQSGGVEGFERDKLPYLRGCGTRVLVNFFGATFDEYVDCGARLDALDGVDGLEMNVSCPNIKAGGIEFGTDPRVLRDLVRACRAAVKKPLWIKLTPNTSDIVALAAACAEGGADGLSIINTITGMAIDARTRRPKIATVFGGLSGPAIKPIALRMVYQVRRAGIPLSISGIGGIQDATDAIEFFLAGASTVQIGTQSFVDPDASGRIVRDLEARLSADGIRDVRELVGALVVESSTPRTGQSP